jgi:predicted transcriptional regulator
MRQILSDETIGELEKLASELEAIRHWDTEYRRSPSPQQYETMAFVSRQERRSEIIRQWVRLYALGHLVPCYQVLALSLVQPS